MIDILRQTRVKDALENAGLDVLICRLAENVLFLTGYWPRNGFSFLVFSRNEDPILIVPEGELVWAEQSGIGDIRTFGWGQVKDTDPYADIAAHLESLRPLIGKATIGYEGRFEFVAPAHMAGEVIVSSEVTRSLLAGALPEATFQDATDLIHGLRATKTPHEIDKIRVANEVACLGLKAFAENMVPGRTEAQVAAAIQSAIHEQGIGYRGAQSAWAWPLVMSGLNTVTAHRPYLISSTKPLAEGDLVMVELGTVVDGYWSDLTRTHVVGQPTDRQQEVFEIVAAAQQAAITALKPGATEKGVDRAARSIIEEHDLGPSFVHHTGHGLGFRYHEPAPFLHPEAQGVIQEGMVTSVEPGVYVEGWGGLRIEDNVVVGSDGGEVLSVSSAELVPG